MTKTIPEARSAAIAGSKNDRNDRTAVVLLDDPNLSWMSWRIDHPAIQEHQQWEQVILSIANGPGHQQNHSSVVVTDQTVSFENNRSERIRGLNCKAPEQTVIGSHCDAKEQFHHQSRSTSVQLEDSHGPDRGDSSLTDCLTFVVQKGSGTGIRALRVTKSLNKLHNSEKSQKEGSAVLSCMEAGVDEFRGTVLVDGVKLHAIFDTGCHRVVISPRAVTLIRNSGERKKITQSSLIVTLADGSEGAVHGTTWVKIEYCNFAFVCNAVIMETGAPTDPDIILGNQFMRPACMQFDWSRMKAYPGRNGEAFESGMLIRFVYTK